MSLRRNDKGFGIVGILLVLVALGAITAVGTYVYMQKDKKDDKQSNNITNFEECKAAGYPIAESYPEQCHANGQAFVNESQKPQQELPKESYLEIPELGVKLKLSDKMKGLYYHTVPNRPEAVFFSSDSLKDTGCAADSSAPPVALIKRSEAEVRADSFYASVPQLSKKINGYYYYFQGSQAACSEDEATQQKATELRKSLVEAKDQIEKL